MKPRALVLRTAGTNCDRETAFAFELAGATAESLHVNRLIESPRLLADFQMLAIPGGFSYGDDIAAGRILAQQLTHHLSEPLKEFIGAGKPVIGICNGFQVLVKTDLLPGNLGGNPGISCTLTNNACGRFVDRWVHLAPRSKKCIWTSDLPPLDLPIAHGEGRFVPADDAVRRALWDADQVAFVYVRANGEAADGAFPDNPNGSADDVAGICDETGLVLGLMPHPERAVSRFTHPAWTATRAQEENDTAAPALSIFLNAVRYVASSVGAGI